MVYNNMTRTGGDDANAMTDAHTTHAAMSTATDTNDDRRPNLSRRLERREKVKTELTKVTDTLLFLAPLSSSSIGTVIVVFFCAQMPSAI